MECSDLRFDLTKDGKFHEFHLEVNGLLIAGEEQQATRILRCRVKTWVRAVVICNALQSIKSGTIESIEHQVSRCFKHNHVVFANPDLPS